MSHNSVCFTLYFCAFAACIFAFTNNLEAQNNCDTIYVKSPTNKEELTPPPPSPQNNYSYLPPVQDRGDEPLGCCVPKSGRKKRARYCGTQLEKMPKNFFRRKRYRNIAY